MQFVTDIFQSVQCLRRRRCYNLDFDREFSKTQKDFFLAAMVGDVKGLRRTARRHPESVRWQSKDGFTALMYAVREGRAEAADFLLEAGADATARTDFNYSAETFASRYGHPGILDSVRKFAVEKAAVIAQEIEEKRRIFAEELDAIAIVKAPFKTLSKLQLKI